VQKMSEHKKQPVCCVCGATFACSTLRRRHKQEQHQKIGKLSGPFVVKSSEPFGKLRKLTRKNRKIVLRECRLCDFKSSAKGETEMSSHIRQTHLPETCRFFTCGNTLFVNQQELQLHFDKEHAQEAQRFG